MRTSKLWMGAAAVAAALVFGACERQERDEQQATGGGAAAGQQQPDQQQPTAGAAEGQQQQQEISGELARTSGSTVILRTDEQGEMTLYVDPNTQVMIDGQPGNFEQLQEGSDVRASYSTATGRPKALRIEAKTGQGGQQR